MYAPLKWFLLIFICLWRFIGNTQVVSSIRYSTTFLTVKVTKLKQFLVMLNADTVI